MPPGAISAGISCALHVTFTPLVNDDITASIPFLAETGPFSVPIRCYRKRAVVKAAQPNNSFNIIFGETKTINLTIENSGLTAIEKQSAPKREPCTCIHLITPQSGALDVNFTVKEMVSETSGLAPPPAPNSDPDDQPPPPPVEFAVTSNEMLTYEPAGSCVGYGKSHVALHFKPTIATKFNVRIA